MLHRHLPRINLRQQQQLRSQTIKIKDVLNLQLLLVVLTIKYSEEERKTKLIIRYYIFSWHPTQKPWKTNKETRWRVNKKFAQILFIIPANSSRPSTSPKSEDDIETATKGTVLFSTFWILFSTHIDFFCD